MASVTISKKEYEKLVEQAFRYEYLQQLLKEDVFASPPKKNVKDIMTGFNATKRYSKTFLKSLEKGLKRSSYFVS